MKTWETEVEGLTLAQGFAIQQALDAGARVADDFDRLALRLELQHVPTRCFATLAAHGFVRTQRRRWALKKPQLVTLETVTASGARASRQMPLADAVREMRRSRAFSGSLQIHFPPGTYDLPKDFP